MCSRTVWVGTACAALLLVALASSGCTSSSKSVGTSPSPNPAFASYAWAVGNNGTILATTDGGTHWLKQPSGTTYQLRSVAFADPRHGWVVGSLFSDTKTASAIFATSDGGRTWTKAYATKSESFYDMVCVSGRQLWVAGDTKGGVALILHSDDAGVTWRPQPLTLHDTVDHLSFVDAEDGWASTYGGHVLQTTDGAAHWQVGPAVPLNMLSQVAAVSPTICWGVGAVEGQDGGRIFTYGPHGLSPKQPSETVIMPDGVITYGHGKVGVFGLGWTGSKTGGPGAFWTSTDGGAHWSAADMFDTDPQAVVFTDAAHGWAVCVGAGSSGSILKTTDGGATWTRCRVPEKRPVDLWGVACLPSGAGSSR